jgi:hypothetical protein
MLVAPVGEVLGGISRREQPVDDRLLVLLVPSVVLIVNLTIVSLFVA